MRLSLLFTITHFESISKYHVYTCYLQSHTSKAFGNAMYTLVIYSHTLWKHLEMLSYTLLTFDWSQDCLFNQLLCNNDSTTTSVITAPLQCQLPLTSKKRQLALTSGKFVNDFELTQKLKVVSLWLRLTK